MPRDLRLFIRGPDGERRYIAKLLSSKEGGFSVTPQLGAARGYCIKMRTRATGGSQTVHREEGDQFNVESQFLKLSFHADGRAHFSGQGVRSGYEDGQSKGVSVKSDPFCVHYDEPRSGLLVWGLEGFPIASKAGVTFDPHDMGQHPAPGPTIGYALELYVLPATRRQGIQRRPNREGIWIPQTVIQTRRCFWAAAFDYDDEAHFVGIAGARVRHGIVNGAPGEPTSGFCLSGPVQHLEGGLHEHIHALYPSDVGWDVAQSLSWRG